MDWGGDGVDGTMLDFSYVAKGKAGNMYTIYGRVQKSNEGEMFDTYDIKAGRMRISTQGNRSIEEAIKAHVKAVTGNEMINLGTGTFKLPPPPREAKKDKQGQYVRV